MVFFYTLEDINKNICSVVKYQRDYLSLLLIGHFGSFIVVYRLQLEIVGFF